MASGADNGAADLLDAVRRDPALSMRLMRTVNSSYYGLRAMLADSLGEYGPTATIAVISKEPCVLAELDGSSAA